MTTMGQVDELLASFGRKPPRDAYKQLCEESGVHMQREVYKMLPHIPSAWHRIHTLELDQCLLGPKGCMTILPIVQCSTTLRKVSARSCGVTDEFVKDLCEILQSHPSVRSVDISDNLLVSVFSATPIISLMRGNSNMVAFHVDNTHIGDNVRQIIQQLGEKNARAVSTYYQDNYFRLKDLFNYLDENGLGWVPLKSLVLNCPYPVLQEQFVERIGIKKPKRRSDGCISINTFLQLVYMNYKTGKEIAQFAENTIDEPYVFMVANWKQLLAAKDRYNAQDGVRPIVLPQDLHRLRFRDYLLLNDDADSIIYSAVRLQEEDNLIALQILENPEEPCYGHDASTYRQGNVEDARNTEGPLHLQIFTLLKASRSSFIPPPNTKPQYRFFTDRDVSYISDFLRSGSRLMSIGGMSMLSMGSQAPSVMTTAETDVDPNDPPHTFSLPASVVKMITEFFNQQYKKIPKKKQSTVPDTPRTKRDKALEQSAIPIATFLSAEFATDLERIRPSLLGDYYARHALPIDDCTITLQEMVNVMDEYYVQCRIDTALPLETIETMENPLSQPQYGEFFAKHLEAREDDDGMNDPFCPAGML